MPILAKRIASKSTIAPISLANLMSKTDESTIYTIGHSTRSIETFVELLQENRVSQVVDIRRFPGSRKFPWFNPEPLQSALQAAQIQLRPLEALGGRRKVNPNTHNTTWRNESFRGYADYMETEAFEQGMNVLETLAREQTTAYMCAEAVWWRCHRSMVSDVLKAKGWTVYHIMGPGQLQEHPYTSPARVVGNTVVYTPE